MDINVLVIEDYEPTARMIATFLEEAMDSLSTDIAHDGKEGLALLQGEDGDGTLPDLVLLDLDLPVVDGQTILQKRREKEQLAEVPTIVFSGMDDEETVRACYREGANAFIVKPGDLDAYEEVADSIVDFWFHTASIPQTA